MSEMQVHHTINGVPFETDADSQQYRMDKEMEATASQRYWATLSQETRDVYVRVATVSLELLHASIDYWLPHSLIENAPGDKVVINTEVLFTDVHAQVNMMDEATAFEEQRMWEKIQSKVKNARAERTEAEFLEYVDGCIAHGTRLPNDEVKRLRAMVS